MYPYWKGTSAEEGTESLFGIASTLAVVIRAIPCPQSWEVLFTKAEPHCNPPDSGFYISLLYEAIEASFSPLKISCRYGIVILSIVAQRLRSDWIPPLQPIAPQFNHTLA